jgi:hypothetical protein
MDTCWAMFLLAGCDEKAWNGQPIGDEAELPMGYWQKCCDFQLFSLKSCIPVYIHRKSKK